MNNIHVDNLVQEISKGNVTLFVGSYLSQREGYPSWDKLVNPLKEKLGLPDYENDPIKIVQYYENEHGRNQLVRYLREKLSIKVSLSEDSLLYKLLKLPFENVITTNVDTLIEEYLGKLNKPCHKIINDTDISLTEHMKTPLIKIHGTVDQPETLVFSEDDYSEVFIKKPQIKDKIVTLCAESTFLFVGYSLRDPDLKHILSLVRSRMKDLQREAYLVTYNATEQEKKYWKRFNIHILNVDDNYKIENLVDDIVSKYSEDENIKNKVELIGQQLPNDYGIIENKELDNLKSELEHAINKDLDGINVELNKYNFDEVKRLIDEVENRIKVNKINNEKLIYRLLILKSYYFLENNDLKAAKEFIGEVKKIDKDNYKTILLESKYAIYERDIDKAIELIEPIQNSGNIAKVNLGYLYLQKKRFRDFYNLFSKIESIDFDVDIEKLWAYYYAKIGDLFEAGKSLKKIEEHIANNEKSDPFIYLFIGKIYRELADSLLIKFDIQFKDETLLGFTFKMLPPRYGFLNNFAEYFLSQMKYYFEEAKKLDTYSLIEDKYMISEDKLENVFKNIELDNGLMKSLLNLSLLKESKEVEDEAIKIKKQFSKYNDFITWIELTRYKELYDHQRLLNRALDINSKKLNLHEKNFLNVLIVQTYLQDENIHSIEKDLNEYLNEIKLSDDFDSLVFLMDVYCEIGDINSFENIFKKVSEDFPNNIWVLIFYANYYLEKNNYKNYNDLAKKIIDIFCLLAPDEELYNDLFKYFAYHLHEKKNYTEVIDLYNDTFKEKSIETSGILGEVAIAYIELKKYNDALSLLHKSLKLDPDNIIALNNISVVYYHIGNSQKSVHYSEEAFILASKNYAKDNSNKYSKEQFHNALKALVNAYILDNQKDKAYKLSLETYEKYLDDKKLHEFFISTAINTNNVDRGRFNIYMQKYPDQNLIQPINIKDLIELNKSYSETVNEKFSKMLHGAEAGLVPFEVFSLIEKTSNISLCQFSNLYNLPISFSGDQQDLRIQVDLINNLNKDIVIDFIGLLNLFKFNLFDKFIEHLRKKNLKLIVLDKLIAIFEPESYKLIESRNRVNVNKLKQKWNFVNTINSAKSKGKTSFLSSLINVDDFLYYKDIKKENKNVFYLNDIILGEEPLEKEAKRQLKEYKINYINSLNILEFLKRKGLLNNKEFDNKKSYFLLDYCKKKDSLETLDLPDDCIILIDYDSLDILSDLEILDSLPKESFCISVSSIDKLKNNLNYYTRLEELNNLINKIKAKINEKDLEDVIEKTSTINYELQDNIKIKYNNFKFSNYLLDIALKDDLIIYTDDLGLVNSSSIQGFRKELDNKFISIIALVNYLFDSNERYENYKKLIKNNISYIPFDSDFIFYLLNENNNNFQSIELNEVSNYYLSSFEFLDSLLNRFEDCQELQYRFNYIKNYYNEITVKIIPEIWASNKNYDSKKSLSETFLDKFLIYGDKNKRGIELKCGILLSTIIRAASSYDIDKLKLDEQIIPNELIVWGVSLLSKYPSYYDKLKSAIYAFFDDYIGKSKSIPGVSNDLINLDIKIILGQFPDKFRKDFLPELQMLNNKYNLNIEFKGEFKDDLGNDIPKADLNTLENNVKNKKIYDDDDFMFYTFIQKENGDKIKIKFDPIFLLDNEDVEVRKQGIKSLLERYSNNYPIFTNIIENNQAEVINNKSYNAIESINQYYKHHILQLENLKVAINKELLLFDLEKLETFPTIVFQEFLDQFLEPLNTNDPLKLFNFINTPFSKSKKALEDIKKEIEKNNSKVIRYIENYLNLENSTSIIHPELPSIKKINIFILACEALSKGVLTNKNDNIKTLKLFLKTQIKKVSNESVLFITFERDLLAYITNIVLHQREIGVLKLDDKQCLILSYIFKDYIYQNVDFNSLNSATKEQLGVFFNKISYIFAKANLSPYMIRETYNDYSSLLCFGRYDYRLSYLLESIEKYYDVLLDDIIDNEVIELLFETLKISISNKLDLFTYNEELLNTNLNNSNEIYIKKSVKSQCYGLIIKWFKSNEHIIPKEKKQILQSYLDFVANPINDEINDKEKFSSNMHFYRELLPSFDTEEIQTLYNFTIEAIISWENFDNKDEIVHFIAVLFNKIDRDQKISIINELLGVMKVLDVDDIKSISRAFNMLVGFIEEDYVIRIINQLKDYFNEILFDKQKRREFLLCCICILDLLNSYKRNINHQEIELLIENIDEGIGLINDNQEIVNWYEEVKVELLK